MNESKKRASVVLIHLSLAAFFTLNFPQNKYLNIIYLIVVMASAILCHKMNKLDHDRYLEMYQTVKNGEAVETKLILATKIQEYEAIVYENPKNSDAKFKLKVFNGMLDDINKAIKQIEKEGDENKLYK